MYSVSVLLSAAGGYGLAQAAEEGLLSLAHQLEVQRLSAEVTLGGGVRLQLQTHLLPRLRQLLCAAQTHTTLSHGARCTRYRRTLKTQGCCACVEMHGAII